MGQYFQAVLVDSEQTSDEIISDYQVKLRFLAEYDNPTVQHVMYRLRGNPTKVAWLGDESKWKRDKHTGAIAKFGKERYQYLIKEAGTNFADRDFSPYISTRLGQDVHTRGVGDLIIMNHDDKTYVDLAHYAKTAKRTKLVAIHAG